MISLDISTNTIRRHRISIRRSGWRGRMAALVASRTVTACLLLLSGSVGGAVLSAQSLVQSFFVPIPEDDARTWANAIQLLPANDEMHSVISISPTVDGTVIHYDHWENGYEEDLENPIDIYSNPGNLGGTQIWGDNDPGNGIPPGFASDLINAGDVVVLESDVPLPRDPVAANNLFDGRDKFGSTELLAVTRAAWPSTGIQAQLGAATEVPDTGDWCTRFETPVGIDAQTTPDAFEWVALAVISEKDDTLVSVDANADGDFLDAGDLADVVLNEGETVLVEDVLVGAVVESRGGLVSVQVLSGDFDSTYEGRWFSLIPFIDWGDSYFSPVGDTTTGGVGVTAFIYNPGTSAITVREDDLVALNETFSVPAGTVVTRLLPENATPSAVHYFTPGNEPFYALVAVDADGQIHDWGYTLIPERDLTILAAVGWAPGSTNLTENASPIWVTPEASTTFQFDCDGDGTAEATQAVLALESYQFFVGGTPPAGCVPYDATGLRISTTGDVKFAAAWGQDPAFSGSGQAQQLDMGTAVLPLANPYLLKSSELLVDVNGNGFLDPGDTLLFSLTVESTGTTDLPDVVVSDDPDPNTTYVPNSTFRDGSTPIPDSGTTPFPLDEGGANVGTLSPGQTLLITYQIVLNDPLTEGITGITNTANVTVDGEFSSSSTASEPIVSSGALSLVKVADRAEAAIGETVNYFYSATNNSNQYLSGTLTDDLIGPIVPPVARLDRNLQVMYPFDEGGGATVTDRSGLGPTLDLTVEDVGNVTWGGDTLSINSPTRVSNTTDSSKIYGLCTSTDEITVEAWITPANNTQAGPARIVTQSLDANNRNFTLGQNGAAYQFRLRTTTNGLNGTTVTLDGGVVQTTAPQHVVATRDAAGNAFLYVDGAQVATATIGGDFSNWNAAYDFGLANEFSAGSTDPVRAWLGQYELVSVQCEALTATEVLQNFQAGGDPYLAPGESVSTSASYVVQPGDAPGPVVNIASAVSHNPARNFTLRARNSASVNLPAVGAGAIGDLVWLDIDGDGVLDIGEPGLSGVSVELRDGTCTAGVDCPTTTTDAAGEYVFDQLVAGTYDIFVDETTLPANLVTAPGTTNPATSIVLSAGERSLDVDLGFVPATGTAVIGDFLWSDADGDGVQDPGEVGIGGVTVDLVNPATGGVVATTTTNIDGSYSFTGLAPGEYLVRVTDTGGALSGYTPTSGPQSPGSFTSAPLSVSAGQVVSNTDFGFQNPSLFSINDALWYDLDGNGDLDAGETGIPGVTASLLNSNGDIVASLSDTGGEFSFSGLPNGDYTIDITDVNGVLQGLAATTIPAANGGKGVTIAGGDVAGQSFGFQEPGLIGDLIWSDADGDGIRDPGEPGIGFVTVELLGPGPDEVFGTADDQTLTTTFTTPDGRYFFANTPPGQYRVVVTDVGAWLTGYSQTGDPDETGTCVTCDSQGTPSLSTTVTDLTMDFGYRNAALGDVSGTIFDDVDVDGVEDAAEDGISGITLVLLDSGGNQIAATTTDASGNYSFPDLRIGDYTVQVTDDFRLLDGFRLTSGLDAVAVSMAGSDIENTDFGYVRESIVASIGGTVWLEIDLDGAGTDHPNGLEDPTEAGVPGVTMDLYRDLDADGVFEPTVSVIDGRIDLDGDSSVDANDTGVLGTLRIIGGALDINDDGVIDAADDGTFNGATVIDGLLDLDGDGTAGETNGDDTGILTGDDGTPIATTLTDANGGYGFPGLSAGSFFVDLDETTLPTTSPGDLIETTYPGVEPSAVIALSQGEDYGEAGFGYLPATGTVVLGDRVWYDFDLDGVGTVHPNGLQDPGEIGIGGVDVTINGPGCSPCTVTTNVDGFWLATGLAPGDYFVSYDSTSLPAGFNTTPTNLGGDDTYNLTAVAGDVVTQLDFGFDGGTTGSIGDRIWRDENGDGVQDTGEPGLAGVTVNLLDASGNILGTTTTGPDGGYGFFGVPDGSYTVSISDLAGILVGLPQSYDPDELGICVTCDAEGSLTVAGGVSTPAVLDFGFAPSGGTGTIGDSVWHDVDGDGFQDPSESGIQGVTLELWLDVDNDGAITPGTDNLVRNAVTDQNGEYEFSSLPDGNYVVRVTDTAGVVSSFVQTGDPDVPGVDCRPTLSCDEQGVLILAGGSGDFDLDFGYAAPVGMAYTISGAVFDDLNQDGNLDSPGEPGVAGAQVLLFSDLDGDQVLDPDEPLIGSTVSDANGDYLLEDLPPGDYLVAVDTSGTAVDGYVQTTQVGTTGLQPVTITMGAGDVGGQDFGFWSGGLITTPVTLSYFSSEGAGTVRFEWATATETGNLGFNLYVLAEDGLVRLNDSLVPSHLGDSLTAQRYSLEAWGVAGDQFLLEDVDFHGQLRYHGPFELGQTYGRKSREIAPIDWVGIGREHRRKAKARQTSRRSRLGQGQGFAAALTPAVHLRVSEDGIHRVTYEALLAAGIDLGGVPVAQLALLEGGEPVPIRIEGRGPFGPGSYFEFVGRKLDTLYTKTNVYTLIADAWSAERVDRVGLWTPPSVRTPEFYYETRTVEANRLYDFGAPGDEPWYDARMLAISGPVDEFFELELEDRLPQAGPVELTIAMWGVTNFPQSPDHHVVIEVNGVELADEWFDGHVDHPVQVEIPDWVLQPNDNFLRVLLPHDTGALYDLVNYDHYRVRYPRRFEAVAGRLQFTAAARAFRVDGLPSADVVVYRRVGDRVESIESVQIGGLPGAYSATFPGSDEETTYFVSSVDALHVPQAVLAPEPSPLLQREVDLLIIAHPDFLEGLEPLVAARRSEGLSVQVVNVEEIYDRVGHGVFDPQAIRAFIGQAHREQGTEYVLLVGGDTYDYHDYLGQGSISFVPTLYTRTDSIVHFAPVDPLYGDVDDDGVPDVAVGRWPVRTTTELEAILERTLRYADIDYPQTAVFAADAFDAAAGYSFSNASDEMLGYLSSSWQKQRVYLEEMLLEDARQLLMDEINLGVALTSYFGHSGPSVWSFDGLFDSDDADALENFDRPTVITQWGCWNTYHVMPTYDTLGHRLLLNEGRGAAAVLGAATLTEALSEQRLGSRLFAEIGGQRQRLGKALIDAKRDLAESDPDRLDVLLGWTLLGDPTLVVEP